MEIAMKMMPTVTPTNQLDLEIESYHDEVWTKIYACIDESLVVPSNSTRIDISCLFCPLLACILLVPTDSHTDDLIVVFNMVVLSSAGVCNL